MVKESVLIQAEISPEFATILTPEALEFVAELQQAFNGRRLALLARRAERQAEISAGVMPDFLPEDVYKRQGQGASGAVGVGAALRPAPTGGGTP